MTENDHLAHDKPDQKTPHHPSAVLVSEAESARRIDALIEGWKSGDPTSKLTAIEGQNPSKDAPIAFTATNPTSKLDL